MIDEFWVPISNERADLVTIAERIDAYEIKTARDNLRRLERQVAAYGRVFDRCTAVLAERHVPDALVILPDWWGIYVVSDIGSPALEPVRVAAENPALDPGTLVRLLWRDEAYSALEAVGSPPDPRASRMSLWEGLLDVASEATLRALVRVALLNRDPSRARIPSKRFRVGLEIA